MHDRYVTYREIELTLGISPNSKHSILHEHLVVKTFVLAESRNRSKKALVDCCLEILEKYDGDASKNVYKIITGDESKQNNSPPCEPSKTSQIQRKLFVEKVLRRKLSSISSAKHVM